MRVKRRVSRGLATSTAVAMTLAMLVPAYAAQGDILSKVRIKNFGRINENFYRGAQPDQKDYADLAVLGVKSVVDLQEEGEPREQPLVETEGMKFFRVGLSDKSWPSPEKARRFLEIVNDPANQPVFIHCHGGRHRAGIMTAIYRITHDGWDSDRAYAEMKKYDFDSGFGHGGLKDYVYDYYAHTNPSHKDIVVHADH